MPIIENKLITRTDWKPGDKPKDGIGMCNGMHWDIKNCIIDLTDAPDGSVDEACGITWGSSATFEHCVIRGAGKLVLCGCGDDPDEAESEDIRKKILAERGKTVTFWGCILENFGRRGPEVQGGMTARLYDSMVFNWGCNDQFDTRAFGVWAHDEGRVEAKSTLFLRGERPSIKHWFQDHWYHFGQAVNERGFFKALFHRDAWLSGYKRALTAGPRGFVYASDCYFTDGLVTDSDNNPMSSSAAYQYLVRLLEMKQRLGRELGWTYQGDVDIDADDYLD